MFSPVLAASHESVLGASTNRATLYLFLFFFHTLTYGCRYYLRLKSENAPCLYKSANDIIKRFGK
jgi:hypothetical protein